MNTSLLNNDSAAMDAAQLAVAARKAYEQNRIKECLGLINQLLLCDPGNSEAQALRASVASDVERDISDARILLADSESRSDGHKYRKAAEIILLKVLYIDPTQEEAKTLLATAKGAVKPPQIVPVPAPVAVVAEPPKPKPAVLEDLHFTAQPGGVEQTLQPRKGGITSKLPVIFAGVVLLAGGGIFLSRGNAAKSDTGTEVSANAPAAVSDTTRRTSLAAFQDESSSQTPVSTDGPGALAAAGPAVAPVAPALGFISVSSSIPAEIYVSGKHIGDTPATLQLPAGVQTIEYRHGDLRTTLTHDIKPKETINAVVNFDLTVQINARPWAQVFVEGPVRKPLGQTPLSSVRVPAGSILSFENPNFTSKNYQVTDKDSSIQVVFP
jgi:hypothetical protein